MEILLATHNIYKAEEIQDILPQEINLKTLTDIGFNKEIIEDGKSFAENAKIKAIAGFQFSNIPCVGDDSGLVIDALDGRPGILSARYAGTGKVKDNINKVLQELKNTNNRKAYFITVLCLYNGKEFIYFKGKIDGNIIKDLRGNKGFGYDPIFIPTGYKKTFAELSANKKNKISHRALALKKLKDYISIL